jgi:hypothetical protein
MLLGEPATAPPSEVVLEGNLSIEVRASETVRYTIRDGRPIYEATRLGSKAAHSHDTVQPCWGQVTGRFSAYGYFRGGCLRTISHTSMIMPMTNIIPANHASGLLKKALRLSASIVSCHLRVVQPSGFRLGRRTARSQSCAANGCSPVRHCYQDPRGHFVAGLESN